MSDATPGSPSAASSSPATGAPASGELERTNIDRSWLTKMMVFLVVLVGFGLWACYDLAFDLPQRGKDYASYRERIFLDRAIGTGQANRTSIADPAARLKELQGRRAELEKAEAEFAGLTGKAGEAQYDAELRRLAAALLENAELEWLLALSSARALKAENTTITSPVERQAELTKKWEQTDPPRPLPAYDIPLHWFYAIVALGIAGYMVLLILRVKSKVYTWDAAAQRLTLPGGRSLTPADITEYDKRKWHKFYVTLVTRDGGPPVTLDLYRYAKLEGWVLAMEKTSGGEG